MSVSTGAQSPEISCECSPCISFSLSAFYFPRSLKARTMVDEVGNEGDGECDAPVRQRGMVKRLPMARPDAARAYKVCTLSLSPGNVRQRGFVGFRFTEWRADGRGRTAGCECDRKMASGTARPRYRMRSPLSAVELGRACLTAGVPQSVAIRYVPSSLARFLPHNGRMQALTAGGRSRKLERERAGCPGRAGRKPT